MSCDVSWTTTRRHFFREPTCLLSVEKAKSGTEVDDIVVVVAVAALEDAMLEIDGEVVEPLREDSTFLAVECERFALVRVLCETGVQSLVAVTVVVLCWDPCFVTSSCGNTTRGIEVGDLSLGEPGTFRFTDPRLLVLGEFVCSIFSVFVHSLTNPGDFSLKDPCLVLGDLSLKEPCLEAGDLSLKEPCLEAGDLSLKELCLECEDLSLKEPCLDCEDLSLKEPCLEGDLS